AVMLAVDVPFDSTFRFIAWGLPAALAVAAVLLLQSRMTFPLVLIAIGDASYSLYLFHPYVLKAVEKTVGRLEHLTLASAATTLAYVLAAVLAALYFYRYFERPSIGFLRHAFLESRRTRGMGTAP